MRQSTYATPVLPHDWLRAFFDMGLQGIDQEGRRSPAVSPRYADLTGLPPSLFTVGVLDPLVDDAEFMAARWRVAGNEASLDVWPEGAQAFAKMGTPLSGVAFERATSWIAGVLASDEVTA